jgi:hypothetical protein
MKIAMERKGLSSISWNPMERGHTGLLIPSRRAFKSTVGLPEEMN